MNPLFNASTTDKSLETEGRELFESVRLPAVAVAILWAIHLLSQLYGVETGGLGIYPRRIFGLLGILTGPLVHGSFQHLISNTAPFFVLGCIMIYFYKKVAVPAFVMIYFLTDIAVWLLARPVFHVGISGVIYGMVAFVFWNGLFRGSARSIVLALAVLVFYSGMFIGILPDQEGVSWESHLLGSLVGIFTSYWFRDELEEEESTLNPFSTDNPSEKTAFLPPDIFEKTKAERAEEARIAQELLEKQRLEDEQNNPPGFWNSSYW